MTRRVTLSTARSVWLTALLAPLLALASAWLLTSLAPAGFQGHFEGRLWPWPDLGPELGWLVAAAVVPWLWHRWRRRGLDPWRAVRRAAQPGSGYREPAPEVSVDVPEARPRYIAPYLARLGLALLLLAPLLTPTGYWAFFCHIGCPCESPATKSTAQIMALMALCAAVMLWHAPTERVVFGPTPRQSDCGRRSFRLRARSPR